MTSVFVANLPYWVTDEQLMSLFEGIGPGETRGACRFRKNGS
jgi:hypothetical protein